MKEFLNEQFNQVQNMYYLTNEKQAMNSKGANGSH